MAQCRAAPCATPRLRRAPASALQPHLLAQRPPGLPASVPGGSPRTPPPAAPLASGRAAGGGPEPGGGSERQRASVGVCASWLVSIDQAAVNRSAPRYPLVKSGSRMRPGKLMKCQCQPMQVKPARQSPAGAKQGARRPFQRSSSSLSPWHLAAAGNSLVPPVPASPTSQSSCCCRRSRRRCSCPRGRSCSCCCRRHLAPAWGPPQPLLLRRPPPRGRRHRRRRGSRRRRSPFPRPPRRSAAATAQAPLPVAPLLGCRRPARGRPPGGGAPWCCGCGPAARGSRR